MAACIDRRRCDRGGQNQRNSVDSFRLLSLELEPENQLRSMFSIEFTRVSALGIPVRMADGLRRDRSRWTSIRGRRVVELKEIRQIIP